MLTARSTMQCLVAATLALASSARAADLVIDDFTTGPYSQQFSAGQRTGRQTGAMIGGDRVTVFSVCSTSPCGAQNPYGQMGSYQIRVGSGASSSALLYNAGYRVFPRLDVYYGATTPLGLDLQRRYDRIRVNFESSDQLLNFNVEFFTPTGYSISGCNIEPSTNPFSVDFPFVDFSGTADLGNINMIDFIFGSGSAMGANDWAVKSFEAVEAGAPDATIVCHGPGTSSAE